jgi:Helix-turn-helix family
MSTPFGPQLIGETEKTLNALLRRFLEGTELNESQWVTLRLAERLDGSVDANGLVAAVTERAHFSNAAELVSELARRGLIDDGRLTSAGRAMTAGIQATITTTTAPIWENLPEEDVAAATRVLNEIVTRARAVLASGRFTPVSAKNA